MFPRGYGKGRDQFVARWESRWGEAALLQYRLAVLARVVAVLNFSAAFGLFPAALTHMWAVYTVCVLMLLVPIPLMPYCIVLGIRVPKLIRARYGLVGVKTILLTKEAVNDEKLFDEWVLANRRGAPRTGLEGAPAESSSGDPSGGGGDEARTSTATFLRRSEMSATTTRFFSATWATPHQGSGCPGG